MYYVTVKAGSSVRQMSIEELLFAKQIKPVFTGGDGTTTRTYKFDDVPDKYYLGRSVRQIINRLKEFNQSTEYLRNYNRNDLYEHFKIPKSSGGLRPIDAPKAELKAALTRLADILKNECGGLYHTSAYAYVTGRCHFMGLQKHQRNNSWWYQKLDLSNFFGSTTLEFAMKMLSLVFPFSEVMAWEDGKEELTKAIELGFLNGGLPQGTTLSPSLTNIIMIPIDFEFNRKLRHEEEQFVEIRYADDFIISSIHKFDPKHIEELLRQTLGEFDAPYIIKDEKNRFGSRAGKNWNLGLMINAENKITVGYKKKRELKAMLTSYILDTKNGVSWELGDVQHMEGVKNYVAQIEKETTKEIIDHLNQKFEVDVEDMIKKQLHGSVVVINESNNTFKDTEDFWSLL